MSCQEVMFFNICILFPILYLFSQIGDSLNLTDEKVLDSWEEFPELRKFI